MSDFSEGYWSHGMIIYYLTNSFTNRFETDSSPLPTLGPKIVQFRTSCKFWPTYMFIFAPASPSPVIGALLHGKSLIYPHPGLIKFATE